MAVGGDNDDDDDDATLSSSSSLSDTEEESDEFPPWIDTLIKEVVSVSLFAMLGTAARIFLQELALLLPVMKNTDLMYLDTIPNLIGCLIIGFVHGQVALKRKYPTIPVALGSGLCGCMTSFSSFMFFASNLFIRFEFSAAFFFFLFQHCSYMMSFFGGLHASFAVNHLFGLEQPAVKILDPRTMKSDVEATRRPPTTATATATATEGASNNSESQRSQPGIRPAFSEYNVHRPQQQSASGDQVNNDEDYKEPTWVLMVFTTGLVLLTILSLLLIIFVADAQVIMLSLLMAPAGALIRFFLGKYLNKARLPFGTLSANLLGILVKTIVLTLATKYDSKIEGDEFEDQTGSTLVLASIGTGFAGSVSTVSSFVKELALMTSGRYHLQWAYATITYVSSFLIVILIWGTYYWVVKL